MGRIKLADFRGSRESVIDERVDPSPKTSIQRARFSVGENTNGRDEVDVKCCEERVTCFSPIHGDFTQRGVGYET